ncbi:hypothetical protein CUC15_19850 [Oceanobacillus zhaokaii]|uniref:HEAT repeat domain-containing protein n=1 Tax=Oceanobacillus zhaokaii TaxID=2052660 RepID=A0A345PM07_9BACI|nr:HEAT repeat domain-containing protein [Oceanobacillus zhaokaii]AXI11037.1 hypothetical protein CUC15_19850 [Oceanobacillus zhaokaii]
MKSSDSRLKGRGKIVFEDLHLYNGYTKMELIELIKSKEAYKRTIAVKLLSEKSDLSDDLMHLFLNTLAQEKKLYTKIELCDALSKGGRESAKVMVEYLGKIGNNQHKVLPTDGFNKNSYPLPRDIIARTLAHMDEEILPILLYVLKANNPFEIQEGIDAIGFICFNRKIHRHSQIIDALIQCLKDHYNDEIIRWKLVRSFESFNDINMIKILQHIEQEDIQPIIRIEAKRSLSIINNRTKGWKNDLSSV